MKKNLPGGLLSDGERKKARTFLRATLAFALLFGLSARSAASPQSRQVNLDMNDVSIFQLLDEINRQTGLRFVYNTDELRSLDKIDVDARQKDVDEIFAEVLRGTGFTFMMEDGVVMLVPVSVARQQPPRSVTIRGEVRDDVSGEPLAGVAVVLVQDNTVGVATDHAGQFVINIPARVARPLIEFSFLGYESRILDISTGPVSGHHIVSLRPAATSIDDVVITGYQELDRRNLTSAVTTLKMDEIAMPGVNTVDQMLEGNVPGMIYMQNTGQVGAAPKLRVRGSSSILGNQEPLWVVDGIIVQDKVNIDPAQLNDLDFVNLLGNAISGLNPADIDQIDVLKDAAATALYGARAANGVIVITTKKGTIGGPKVSYSMSGTFTPRPRYTDREFNMMNSKERVDVSRELLTKGVRYAEYYPGVEEWIGYERAYLDYYQANTIDFDEFSRLSQYYETMNTDWLDLLMRDTFSHNHTVSLNGGTENIRYYASVGFADEKGNVRDEKSDRYTATFKTNLTYDKLTAEFGVIGNISEKSYNPTSLKVMDYAYSMNRALPMYGEDGELWYYNRTKGVINRPFNIRNEMDNSSWDIDQHSVNVTGQVNYKFSDEFSVRGVASYQFGYTDDRNYFSKDTWQVQIENDPRTNDAAYPYKYYMIPFGGQLLQKTTKNSAYTFRLQADWNKYLGADNKHFVNVMGGYEFSSSRFDNMASEQRGYFEDGKTVAAPPLFTNGPNVDWKHYEKYYNWLINNRPTYTETLTNMVSAYATATYVYDNRYILNVNARADWSNAFGNRSNEKFFPIWSISGRWNVSDEKFMENVGWVDNLALRLSYGLQGNMLNNQPARLIISKKPVGTTGEDYATIVNIANPDLKWEKTNSYNAGIDFSLFGNKVRGSFAYYYKRTTDAFLPRRVGSQNGTLEYVVNAGDIENHGVEFALNFTPIDRGIVNGKRGFVWRFDPQIGQAVNQLINRAINRNNDFLQDEITFMDLLNGTGVLPGDALNTFYSFRYKELDEYGRPVFYGLDPADNEAMAALNERYTAMAEIDRKNVWLELLSESGTRVPVIQGSLRNYFAYRNFGLSVNLTYSLGNKVRLFNLASGDYSGVRPMPHQNVRKEFVDRWQRPGDEKRTDIPGLAAEIVGQGTSDTEKVTASYGWWYAMAGWAPNEIRNVGGGLSKYGMYDYSDLRVASGDYLRLQALVLSYTLGDRALKTLGIGYANFSFSAMNLFTICDKKLKGQNPEQFGTSEMINISLRPQYTFGLNINF